MTRLGRLVALINILLGALILLIWTIRQGDVSVSWSRTSVAGFALGGLALVIGIRTRSARHALLINLTCLAFVSATIWLAYKAGV